jgi:hypothetical protein
MQGFLLNKVSSYDSRQLLVWLVILDWFATTLRIFPEYVNNPYFASTLITHMDQLLSDDITHTSSGNRPLVQKKNWRWLLTASQCLLKWFFFHMQWKILTQVDNYRAQLDSVYCHYTEHVMQSCLEDEHQRSTSALTLFIRYIYYWNLQ